MAEINYIDANSIGNMVRAIKVKTDMTYATKDELSEVSNKVNQAGSTAARPTTATLGQCYFDTGLNKPIWFNGTKWVDYTGTEV
jgi:hypothetical protein